MEATTFGSSCTSVQSEFTQFRLDREGSHLHSHCASSHRTMEEEGHAGKRPKLPTRCPNMHRGWV